MLIFAPMKRIFMILIALIGALVVPSVWQDAMLATAQTINSTKVVLKGVVVDALGEPLLGVTVQQRGTQARTVTDFDGRFTLAVSDKLPTTLVLSYIGMKTLSVDFNSSVEQRRIVMQDDEKTIKDVVIVGAYGTVQKRSDLVGSAYQVTSKDLQNLPALRVDQMLEGLVPGLTIEANTDTPGSVRSRYNTRIRGDGSLSASKEPLWIIDGMPLYTGGSTNQMPGQNYTISPLSLLNPDDIESITVLKDAVSTAIYGADGANGVILVTLKKGREGKTNVNASVQYGITKMDMSTAPKMLNAEQYMQLAREAWANAGKPEELFPFQDSDLNSYSTTNTNWYDLLYQTGSALQTNISASGGNETSTHYLSASFYQQEPITKGTKTQRASLNSDISFKIGKRVDMGVTLSSTYTYNDMYNLGRTVYRALPIMSPYNEDGSLRLYYKEVVADDEGNPSFKTYRYVFNDIAEREQNIYNQKSLVTDGKLRINVRLIDGLQYQGKYNIHFQNNFEETYNSMKNWTGMDYVDGQEVRTGYSSRQTANYMNWSIVNQLNFNRDFGKHHVDAFGVIEAKSQEYTTVYASGSGFMNDKIQDVSQANVRDGKNSSSTTRALAYRGQVSYSFDRRYYLTFNASREGNSLFGSDVRWAPFASVGVSWNVHNEKFLKLPEWVNVLKLRATYGKAGNSRLGTDQAKGIYSYGESYAYNGETGGQQSGSPNPGLSWETKYTTNLSLRFELFNRVDVEVEYYNANTVNLLSQLPVSRTTGSNKIYRNVGEINNRGIEVTIESKNIVGNKKGDFTWTTLLNASHNSNKLTKLYNHMQTNFTDGTSWIEGSDIHTYYLVRWAGVDPADGMPMWYDKDGNVTKTYSTTNRVATKNSTCDVTGGMTNTFTYKDFSLRTLIKYQIGGYTRGGVYLDIINDGYSIGDQNVAVEMLDHWRQPGDVSVNPKPIWGVSTQSGLSSTRFLLNKTMIQLGNVVLSYSLPAELLKPLSLRKASVSFVGDNLLTWTPYSKSNKNSYKTTMGGYPVNRSYSFALNVGL